MHETEIDTMPTSTFHKKESKPKEESKNGESGREGKKEKSNSQNEK